MSILELLTDLDNHGVRIWLDGGDLRFDLTKGEIPADLHQRLVLDKNNIAIYIKKWPLPVSPDFSHLLTHTNEAPLTSGQLELWIMDQLSHSSSANNIINVIRINPDIHEPVIHELLRTFLEIHPASLVSGYKSNSGNSL